MDRAPVRRCSPPAPAGCVADATAAFAGSRLAEVAWAPAAALCRPDEQRPAEVALERCAAGAVRPPLDDLDDLDAVEAAFAVWLASTYPSPRAVARSMEVLSDWPADPICLGMPILCLGPRDRYLALGHAGVGDLDQALSLLLARTRLVLRGGAVPGNAGAHAIASGSSDPLRGWTNQSMHVRRLPLHTSPSTAVFDIPQASVSVPAA